MDMIETDVIVGTIYHPEVSASGRASKAKSRLVVALRKDDDIDWVTYAEYPGDLNLEAQNYEIRLKSFHQWIKKTNAHSELLKVIVEPDVKKEADRPDLGPESQSAQGTLPAHDQETQETTATSNPSVSGFDDPDVVNIRKGKLAEWLALRANKKSQDDPPRKSSSPRDYKLSPLVERCSSPPPLSIQPPQPMKLIDGVVIEQENKPKLAPVFIARPHPIPDPVSVTETSDRSAEEIIQPITTSSKPSITAEDPLSEVFYPDESVAVFVDGANNDMSMKGLVTKGYIGDPKFDYLGLYRTLKRRCHLKRIYYYAGLLEIDRNMELQARLDWMSYNHIDVKVKEGIRDAKGCIVKSNVDVELSLDMYKLAVQPSAKIDHVVLFSGDSDFSYPIELIKDLGIRTTVVGCQLTGSASSKIRRSADQFIELKELIDLIKSVELHQTLLTGK